METNERGSDAHGGFADAQGQYQAQEFQAPSEGSIRDEILAWKRSFAAKRNTILIALILSLIGSALFYIFYKPTLTATTELLPVSDLEIAKYDDLNALLSELDSTPGRSAGINLKTFRIGKEELRSEFLQNIQDRSVFAERIAKASIIQNRTFENEDEKNEAIQLMSFGVGLTPPAGEDEAKRKSNANRNWLLSYSAKMSEAEIRSVINDALDMGTERARVSFKNRFELLFESQNNEKDRRIKDITRFIKNTTEEYKVELEREKLVLEEQAQIARALGIPKSTLEGRALESESKVIGITDQSYAKFYRGYQAIEKEIELIDKRENVADFAPRIARLEGLLKDIKSNPLLQRLERTFDKSPIKTKKFKAVNYYYYGITVTEGLFRTLIAFLILILGIFFAAFSVLSHRLLHED